MTGRPARDHIAEGRSGALGSHTTTYFQVLARAGAALAPALDSIDVALDELAAVLVPEVADWFAVHLFSQSSLEKVAERGPAPAGPAVAGDPLAASRSDDGAMAGVADVVASGGTVQVAGLLQRQAASPHERWWQERGLDSVMVLPVRTRGLTLGAVSLGSTGARGAFTDADAELATAIAGRIATALERVAQHRETEATARDAARQATRLRHLMEAAVVLGGARTEKEVVHRLAAAARRVSGGAGAAVAIERGPGGIVKTVEGAVPEDVVEFPLFDGKRQRVGQLVVARPATDAEGFELAMVALAQIGGALVENRRLVDSLERSRAHLQALVDASPDAIVELDAGGLVLTANRVARDVLGEPLPLRLGDLLDARGLLTFEEHLAKAVADQAPPRFEVTAHRHGEPIVLSIALAPLLKGNRTERIVALVSDVTEQRRMEEQFLRAQRMDAIGRLAGGIAHDFNNLITAIIGFGELAASSLDPGHSARDDIEEVIAAGRRAAELTSQLLTLGRGQMIARSAVDVAELFDGMQRMLERVLPADVQLEMVVEGKATCARGDRGQLEQVLLNLAINARDAMPGGGTLTVRAEDDPRAGVVRITVTDTGTGMDPVTVERCFEPFFTTKEQGRGTGLGLSAVYGIVAQHHGTISVSSAVGEGTSFTIDLPATDDAGEPAAPPSGDPVSGTETVLLVEDQTAVRALMTQVLRSRGYRVLPAADATAALAIARSEGGPIDLLVTDIVMPGASGADLADQLRGELPDLRILYISGYTKGALEQRGSIDGEIAFLAKPFNPTSLARRVRDVLDAPGPGAQGSNR